MARANISFHVMMPSPAFGRHGRNITTVVEAASPAMPGRAQLVNATDCRQSKMLGRSPRISRRIIKSTLNDIAYNGRCRLQATLLNSSRKIATFLLLALIFHDMNRIFLTEPLYDDEEQKFRHYDGFTGLTERSRLCANAKRHHGIFRALSVTVNLRDHTGDIFSSLAFHAR